MTIPNSNPDTKVLTDDEASAIANGIASGVNARSLVGRFTGPDSANPEMLVYTLSDGPSLFNVLKPGQYPDGSVIAKRTQVRYIAKGTVMQIVLGDTVIGTLKRRDTPRPSRQNRPAFYTWDGTMLGESVQTFTDIVGGKLAAPRRVRKVAAKFESIDDFDSRMAAIEADRHAQYEARQSAMPDDDDGF